MRRDSRHTILDHVTDTKALAAMTRCAARTRVREGATLPMRVPAPRSAGCPSVTVNPPAGPPDRHATGTVLSCMAAVLSAALSAGLFTFRLLYDLRASRPVTCFVRRSLLSASLAHRAVAV
jgi:hypothetical protein